MPAWWSVGEAKLIGVTLLAATCAWGTPVCAQEPGTSTPEMGARLARIRALTSPRPEGDVTERVVEVSSTARAIELGLVPITRTRATFRGSWADWLRLQQDPDISSATWSPGRHLLLDQVAEMIHLPEAQESFGLDGRGVLVGIVDTGIDVFHPDFIAADGTTRVRWLLAYDEAPRGVHAALERDFHCDSVDDPCAIYDAFDLNEALAAGDIVGRRRIPADTFGHGSHVASIAAGGGTTYQGVAPGAGLVVVKGAASVSVPDARILEGCRFIFDRAAEDQAAAVINLSLGSGFGAHDGSSALEQSLDELAVGPGRVIVTAAGNDGNLYEPMDDEPFPVGTHTEVYVPPRTEVGVSLFEAGGGLSLVERGVFVWLALSPQDRVSVGIKNAHGTILDLVSPGSVAEVESKDLGTVGDFVAYVGNGNDAGLDVGLSGNNVAVVLVGTWPDDAEFQLVLSGQGTARAWVDGFSYYGLPFSVLFGRARMGGTVGIPASAPGMIAVGASVSRLEWTDYTGFDNVHPYGDLGDKASFSSAGPNQLGQLKPDLLAPGTNVVAAMSRAADPRLPSNEESQFMAQGACEESETECLVVDDQHGVSSGTSMAAPVVTGAVALLLQRQPELDQPAVKRLLRAGAAPLPKGTRAAFSGAGLLDVEALLLAQDALVQPSDGLPAEPSRLVLSDVFLTPDPTWSLEGLLLLKDREGLPAGDFEQDRLRLEVEGEADLEMLERKSSIQSFRLAGRRAAGEQEVIVRAFFDDRLLAEQTLPVVVDAANVRGGLELTGGACAVAPLPLQPFRIGLGAVGVGLVGIRGWRRRRKTLVR